jgi:cyanophycinase
VIVGGGPIPDEIDRRFIELAGGPERARIVVVPNASADAAAAGKAKVDDYAQLGATAVTLDLTTVPAGSDSAARLLGSATGIWFPGGVQSRLTRVMLGTPALDSVRSRYRRGAVIGGTSAGAAIMSDPMITGDERRPGGARPPRDSSDAWLTIDRENVGTAPGFGLLPGVIVDQHFLRRKRHNRLISLVLERPTEIGAGIDESTALVVGSDGRWEVIGASQVVVYDARPARHTGQATTLGAAGVRLHILPAGSTFDPATGSATVPGGTSAGAAAER